MRYENFNMGWEVVTTQKDFPFQTSRTPVTLPYDDLLNVKRIPEAPGGAGAGFYPERVCTMEKHFFAPEEWKEQKVIFEFEGVYANSMVYINREYAGGCSHGYTNFLIEADDFLKYGQDNEIKVIARSTVDSRWYTGVGIYRNVNLFLGNSCYVTVYGHRIRTTEVDAEGAMVGVAVELENLCRFPRTLTVETRILDVDGEVVANGREPVTVFPGKAEVLRQRLYLQHPNSWSVDRPYLYKACTEVYDNGVQVDYVETNFGVRTLALDTIHGLRINGESVKLRGACIHHDNGLLGAADIERAEERRVQLLKQAGFNAVRSAHNPVSRAFLNACDRYGMLVMDELSDMWTQPKTDYDYAASFSEHWEQLVTAMIDKDFNHPSVIMYSIGNEIPEISNPHGANLGRSIAEKFHEKDPDRYTINSMNLIMAAMGRFTMTELVEQASNDVNDVMTNLGDKIDIIANSQMVTDAVRESLAATDIIGYNYATGRYVDDKYRLPNHVLCGSETYPAKIAENWRIIKENSHVIGDFTWTGWDYLGEAGVGQIRYKEDGESFGYRGNYPCFIAYCGDIDILGHRRPVSYYREIVFGLRKQPYIAVQYPWRHEMTPLTNKWGFFDGISSWTWQGYEEKEIAVQVYAPGDTVTLFCNGEKIAEAKVHNFIADFSVIYHPGKLTAVASKEGVEFGRTELITAAETLKLQLQADCIKLKNSDKQLAYIDIDLVDENGIVNNMADREITVKVEGAGKLEGLGSANPMGTDSFRTEMARTYDGRAQAIVRPNGAGEIHVTVNAEGLEKQCLILNVEK